MSLHNIEDLMTSCMDFQANIVRVTYRKKMTMLDPEEDLTHADFLAHIWAATKLGKEVDANGQSLKWRKLGFDTEDIAQEFNEVGVLGIECLVRDLAVVKQNLSNYLPVFNDRRNLLRVTQIFPK